MTDIPVMGDDYETIEELVDNPLWWEFHAALWEDEYEE